MQTEQPIKDYQQNVYDLGFSVATGVLMVIVLIIFAVSSYKFLTGILIDKLDGLKEEVIELKEKLNPIYTYINIQLKGTINGDDNEE